MKRADYTFGGRIRPKEEAAHDWADLVRLANKGIAFIYQRLSSHEQVKKHIYSVQAQDGLVDLVSADGYPDDLIYVERRDLGISGTKGQEERAGLAHLIAQIEAGTVESVYVVHISRLFRDQTLINAFAFAELCKQYNVIIVTPQMRLNLNDRMHMRLYRMEAERAADELELMSSRLHGGQRLKARQGYYAGGSVPTGYIVDMRKQIEVDGQLVDNPGYDKYMIYEPHAEIVRRLFRMARIPGITVHGIHDLCLAEGISIPPFSEEIAALPANVKGYVSTDQNPDGSWRLLLPRVRGILRNPVYMGWWVWGGELLKMDNHPPIISDEDFWAAQNLFRSKPFHRRSDYPPLPLAGLLYCGEHEVPRRMIYSNGKTCEQCTYQCRDERCTVHHAIRADHLDGPIGEVVVSQCACPELVDEVLGRLVEEFAETQTRVASLQREHARLTKEIETLEYNFLNARLSPERATAVEAQIQSRLAQLKELADIRNTEMGRLVGPVVTQDEVGLVKRFLSNLEEGWAAQPPDLQNAFLRLVLERITIWYSAPLVRVRLTWRTGLEQELMIRRPYIEPRKCWTEEEIARLKEYYEATPRDELKALFPGWTWGQVRRAANRLGLKRKVKDKRVVVGIYDPWENEVVEQLTRGELTMLEALERLGNRTEDSVRCQAKRLGLRRNDKMGPKWEWLGESNSLTTEPPVGPTRLAHW